jgi:hypothetical protein
MDMMIYVPKFSMETESKVLPGNQPGTSFHSQEGAASRLSISSGCIPPSWSFEPKVN